MWRQKTQLLIHRPRRRRPRSSDPSDEPHFLLCHPDRSEAERRDLRFPSTGNQSEPKRHLLLFSSQPLPINVAVSNARHMIQSRRACPELVERGRLKITRGTARASSALLQLISSQHPHQPQIPLRLAHITHDLLFQSLRRRPTPFLAKPAMKQKP
jgi:hypothetical protein